MLIFLNYREFGSSVKNKPQRKRCRTTLKRNKSIPVRKHQRRKTRQKSPNIIFIKPKEEVSQFHIKIAESGHNKNKVILPSGEEVVSYPLTCVHESVQLFLDKIDD